MHSIIPENAIGDVAILNRNHYLANADVIHAAGKYTSNSTLVTSKPYKGPEIKPLLP